MGKAHDEIRAAGGDVVAIFQYRAEPTRHFCRQRGVPFDCLGDPEREGYDTVGLEHGKPLDLIGPKSAVGWLKAAAHGNFAGGAQGGDVTQMPGTFVVAPDGTVAFAHYNRDTADNPSNKAVLAAVRKAAAAAEPTPG